MSCQESQGPPLQLPQSLVYIYQQLYKKIIASNYLLTSTMCQNFEEATGSISQGSCSSNRKRKWFKPRGNLLSHVTKVVRVGGGVGLFSRLMPTSRLWLGFSMVLSVLPSSGGCFTPRLAAQVLCHQFQGHVSSSTASLSSDGRIALLGHRVSLSQSL